MVGHIDIYGFLRKRGEVPCIRGMPVRKGGMFSGIYNFVDGETIIVYRGTGDHINPRSNISLKRSKDLCLTWSEPQILCDSGDDDRNPAVGIHGDLVVMLYCTRINKKQVFKEGERNNWEPTANVWIQKYKISKDRGKTWTEEKVIPSPKGWHLISSGAGNNLAFNPFDMTFVGSIFALKGDNTEYTGQAHSEWYMFPAVYSISDDKWTFPYLPIQGGSDECDFWYTRNGTLGSVIRTGGIGIDACYTTLYDLNTGWSKPKLCLPDGLHPARLTKIPISNKYDSYLMSFGRRRWPYGAGAIISTDDCESWDWDCQLLLADNSGDGEKRCDNGYCSSVYLPKDDTLVSTWYRNVSIEPYFPGTANEYLMESAKYKLSDVLAFKD